MRPLQLVCSLFFCLLTLVVTAFGQRGPVTLKPSSSFGGVYVGAVVGYGVHKGKTHQRVKTAYHIQNQGDSTQLEDEILDRSHRNTVALEGLHGGIYAGYGHVLRGSRVYLGVEAGYFWKGAKGKQTYTPDVPAIGDVLKTQVNQGDSLEVSGRIGLVCHQAMPYLKMGWSNTKVDATQTIVPHGVGTPGRPGDPNAVPPVPPVDAIPSGALAPLTQKFLSKRINGFLVGIGVDVKVGRGWVAGLEYTHTIYPKKQGGLQVADTTVVPPTQNAGWQSGVRLSSNTVRFRMAYHF